MNKLHNHHTLSFEEAYKLQSNILQGQATEEELLGIFRAMDRPPTAEELLGFFTASKEHMVSVKTAVETLDTCGTGGDGLQTFNISTAAAIVCASLGVPVAKHGNRSSSSKCGSADVLEVLGVNIELGPEAVASCIFQTGIGFIFAPMFHPAFRYAGLARKAFGKRTYFNYLGPLLNPANAEYRVLGVSNVEMVPLIGSVLINTGVKRAWVFCSEEGMDEISVCGKTHVTEFIPGHMPREFVIDAKDLSVQRFTVQDLRGGDSQDNALIIQNILSGRGRPAHTLAVALNAAAGLVVYGKAKDLPEALSIVMETFKTGSAIHKLNELIQFSRKVDHVKA